jgi:hypothetical protein
VVFMNVNFFIHESLSVVLLCSYSIISNLIDFACCYLSPFFSSNSPTWSSSKWHWEYFIAFFLSTMWFIKKTFVWFMWIWICLSTRAKCYIFCQEIIHNRITFLERDLHLHIVRLNVIVRYFLCAPVFISPVSGCECACKYVKEWKKHKRNA